MMVLGSFLSLSLVSKCRNVVVGLWATRMLYGCRICEMVSEVPLMQGRVTVVTGVGVPVGCVSFGRFVNVSSNKVSVVVVLVKKTPSRYYFSSRKM